MEGIRNARAGAGQFERQVEPLFVPLLPLLASGNAFLCSGYRYLLASRPVGTAKYAGGRVECLEVLRAPAGEEAS